MVACTNLTSGAVTADGSSGSTSSVTLTANRLYLITIKSRTGISTNPNQPTLTLTGATFVAIDSTVTDTAGASRQRLTLFRTMVRSDTTGTITVDFGGQTQTVFSYIIDELTGMDTSGSNGAGAIVQSAKNTITSAGPSDTQITATLAAFGSANNATYGAFGNGNTTSSPVHGSGFTTIKDFVESTETSMELLTEFNSGNDTTVDVTFTSDAECGIIAVEVRNEVIVFDVASNSGYQTAQSTYSWSHTVVAGANRYLIVGVSMLSVAGSSVTGITYNSVNLTLIGSIASVSGAVRMELWGLVAPATGANTIAVTLSTGLDSVAGAISFTGVHQASPYEGFNSASATNVGAADATVNVTTVADNDMVVDTVATDDTAITVGAGQTSRWNVTGTLGSGAGSTEGLKTPAGTVTMSWTNVGAAQTWSIGAVALRDVNASTLGGGTVASGFMTTNTRFFGG